jgi:thioredoxin reductase (NADPH)
MVEPFDCLLHSKSVKVVDEPDLANLEAFTGRGIYYNATFMEAQACAAEPVIVVGGGNSAGQAAVFLSQNAADVTMLVRGPTLAATMSRYLVQRIEENSRIQVHYLSEITELVGADHLEQVRWLDRRAMMLQLGRSGTFS